jgi:hypothetical protein
MNYHKNLHSHSESRRPTYENNTVDKRGFTTESMLNSSVNITREKRFRHPRIFTNKKLNRKMDVFSLNNSPAKLDSKRKIKISPLFSNFSAIDMNKAKLRQAISKNKLKTSLQNSPERCMLNPSINLLNENAVFSMQNGSFYNKNSGSQEKKNCLFDYQS